jgi:tripartite-type tricarboxylate transporter receptor subunit TctC
MTIDMSKTPLARPVFTRLAAAALAFATLLPAAARAQTAEQWPTKPVRILIPVGPGGAADTLARNLANAFPTHANGHALVVENRPGAGGTIAATAVVREAPDGYNLFLADVGPNAVSHTMAKLSYDPHTAFTPIIHAANLPAVIVVRPELPHKSLDAFIAAAKKEPGKFNFASAGLGNWTHLFMTHLNQRAGIDQVSVVFRSGPEMATAVMRGDADTAVLSLSTSLQLIQEGKLHALAGVGARPMPQLPNTAAVAKDIPGFDVAIWHGIVGPAGMDAALVKRINAVFNAVLADPAVKKALTEAQAADIIGGTPEKFDAFIKAELQRWPEVMKALGTQPK